MNDAKRVMLLIDADNVSADVIEQAVERVHAEHGAIHVRRAYCTAESAVKHLKLFKALSVRPIVNVSTGKNSTDIALAVDALDLVLAERPQVAVIVSSDSDFAPLVIRLREKGCRVQGIGQEGKTGEDSKLVYDDFIDLPHRKAKAPRQAAAKTPAAKRGGRKAAAAPPAPPPLPDEVQRILEAMPALKEGGKLPLNTAAELLRGAKLLTRNAPSTKLFKKYLDYFVLSPEKQPNQVQYRAPT
ncbi:NYN domain-containing protein [Piscinibacter sp. XHJ-5]|uniref:NYN domain-containing protein n=1 Tax=Piscinibacter sp. XHJ-5 TaxID=3037797 RepID=UPI0024535759|nr:NYN domain-containing protein [Piscinibacter sp. XHJ-5]